jgi:hypothetical protein
MSDRGWAPLAALEQLVPLAPLHQPPNLAPIRLLLPGAPSELGRVRARRGQIDRSRFWTP